MPVTPPFVTGLDDLDEKSGQRLARRAIEQSNCVIPHLPPKLFSTASRYRPELEFAPTSWRNSDTADARFCGESAPSAPALPAQPQARHKFLRAG